MADNEAVIRVSAKTNPNGLGESISIATRKGEAVVLSAIGPVAVSTAMKGVCAANRNLGGEGICLAVYPGLVVKKLPDHHGGEAEVECSVMILRLVRVVPAGGGALWLTGPGWAKGLSEKAAILRKPSLSAWLNGSGCPSKR